MRLVAFSSVVERAVASGLAAAALVDRNGTTIAFAGDIDEETAMPLVSRTCPSGCSRARS